MASLSRRDLIVLLLMLALASFGWPLVQGWQQRKLGPEIARLARPGDIRMLSSQTCLFCASARHWLESNHVAFQECIVEKDAACAAAFSAQQSPGTPLLFVRGRPQVGFDPQQVLDALQAPAGG